MRPRSGSKRRHWRLLQRRTTRVFKALADSTRQQILELLEGQERSVGEIVENFHLSQPTISRHLAVLREADLVVDERHGQNVYYRLNGEALTSSMQDFFGRFSSCQPLLKSIKVSSSRDAGGREGTSTALPAASRNRTST
jgi:DNA-binding transcriptional ArsR family regulator